MSAGSTCLYGMSVFGISAWAIAILLAALLLAVSAFTPRLDLPARVLGHAFGILSLLALGLLLLAGSIGGRFHLSSSNEVIAWLLFLVALFGMTSFLWPGAAPKPNAEAKPQPPAQG